MYIYMHVCVHVNRKFKCRSAQAVTFDEASVSFFFAYYIQNEALPQWL